MSLGKALRAARSRNQPELDLGEPKTRAWIGNAGMAGKGNLATAAERGAMNRRNDRLGAGLDGVDHVGQVRFARRLAEFADVGTGHEGAAGAGDHDGFDLRIPVDLLDRHQQTRSDRLRRGIDRRVVDLDQGHRRGRREPDGTVVGR